MGTHVYWLFILALLYWGYCITIGIKGYLAAKSGTDYFIAGRQLNVWVFVLAATATSFSGWTFIGHPAMIWRDGFPYGFASFYVIAIPFTGVLFLKRQWLIGKRYGYVTPGEMYCDYFKSETMRILTVIIALLFSIPYLGIQLRASGLLFNILTDGMFSVNVGMWLLATVVFVYVSLGGLRSVAYVDAAQCILLWGGIAVLGVIAASFAGGFDSLATKFGDVVNWIQKGTAPQWVDPVAAQTFLAHKEEIVKITPDGYSHLVAVPSIIQFVPDASQATGGQWSGMMVMSFMLAMMGVHASPSFSMWAFANKNPRPFPLQQVWASSFGIGFTLVIFTTIQGMGGWVLSLWRPEGMDATILPLDRLLGGNQDYLVPYLIHLMKDSAPFLVGLLAICALAAMQSTGAAYMSTTSGMLTRDVIKRHLNREMTELQQTHYGRLCVLIVICSAWIFASVLPGAIVMLGGLGVSYGLMMYPALIAVCYWPFLTRQGVIAGLICGMIAVTLTFEFNFGLPWGAYAFTWHCAGWGILCNLPVAIVVSFFTQPGEEEKERLQKYHQFIRKHAALKADERYRIKIGWVLAVIWFLFAIGPFGVLGNTIFGNPLQPETWFWKMPSIWIWQIIWWAFGVYMMWYLAYQCKLSTDIKADFDTLRHDHYEQTNASIAPH